MQRETFTLKLVDAKMVTRSVRHLEFERSNGQPFDFVPGQFITFHFEMGGAELQRSYSVATIPGISQRVEIAVSPFEGGPGTRLLFGIQPGDTLETTGPFGRLILRDEQPKRYILVATGTGVTPYRAMLPELLLRAQTHDAKVVILQGVQTPEDLLYPTDFLHYTEQSPNLEFRAYYSRKLPDQPGPHERKGYVQNAFTDLILNPETDVVYLCGNPNMIDDSFNILREHGFETRQVRREKYISPKR